MFSPSFAMNMFQLARSPKEPMLLSSNNPYPDMHGPEYIAKSAADKSDAIWE